MAQAIAEEIRSEIFQDPKEQHLCTAGSRQLDRYLESGRSKRGFAVLSDQALYCKGNWYVSRDRRRYRKQKTNFRLELSEFQGMKTQQRRIPLLLVLALMFLLLGPAVLLLDQVTGFGEHTVLNPALDAVISLLLAGIFFLLYSIHRRSLLVLLHTNGALGLDENHVPEKEEKLLVRYLRAYLNAQE